MLYHKECIQYYWAHCELEEGMSYDLLSEHGGKPSNQIAFMLYAYSTCVLARVYTSCVGAEWDRVIGQSILC